MRADELMIGDWVQSKGRPIKIASIASSLLRGHNELATGLADNDTAKGYYFIEPLEPIPLTPEILEKNGFVMGAESPLSKYYSMEIDCENEVYLFIELHIRARYVRISYQPEKGNTITTCLTNCAVHELQHALRLAGINKEIELEEG